MATRILLGLVLILALIPAPPVGARAVCGAYTTREMRAEAEAASQVFIGELLGAAVDGTLPNGHRGSPDATLEFRVTRVHKGDLAVGSTVRVTWQGWAEPEGGSIVGGCRVPGHRPDTTYPQSWLVLAEGASDALVVRNSGSSRQVHEHSQSFIRRITRMARRSR